MSLLGLGALLGVGGLATSLLSNQQANETIQDQNKRSYELALRQQNFAEKSFKQQMRFNNPVTQAALLRASGLNPALMNSGLAGSVSSGSSGTIPSNESPIPIDMSGLASLSQGISLNDAQVRNVESQTQKNEQEAKGLTIDNLFKKEDWISRIYSRDMQSWLNEQLSDSAKLSVQYDKLSMKNRLRELQLNVELKDAQVAAQTISLQYLTPQLAAEINNLMAQQFVAYASGRASLSQAHAAIMQATTNNQEMQAKFGDSPELRRKYSNAVYQGLLAERDKFKSEIWKNTKGDLGLPLGIRAGNILDYSRDFSHWSNKYGR